MSVRFIMAGLLALSAAATAHADDPCEDLEIDQFIEPRTADYAAFGEDSVDEVFIVRATRDEDEGRCRAFLSFSSDSSAGTERYLAGPEGTRLRYELLDESGKLLGDTTRGRDRLNFRFRDGEDALELRVRLSLPSGQTVPAGTYSERVTARLFERRGGGRLRDERGLTLGAAVSSQAEVNLARQPGLSFSAGRSYDVVDFGELETGESRAIIVRVRANSAYRFSLESENLGELVRQGALGANADRVSYSARLDGDSLDLTVPVFALRNPLAPGASEELVFDVVIGDVNTARAGNYADMITITVEPVR